MSSGKIHKHTGKNCHPDARAVPLGGVDLPDHSGVVVRAVPRRQPPQKAVQKVFVTELKNFSCHLNDISRQIGRLRLRLRLNIFH